MNWLPGRVYRFSPKVGNNKWVMATSTHTSASNSFDLLTLCTISTSHRFRLAFEKFLQELTQIFIKLIAVRFFKCARHTLNKRAKCFRAQVQLKRAYKLIYSGSSSSYTIAKVVSLYVHTNYWLQSIWFRETLDLKLFWKLFYLLMQFSANLQYVLPNS